MRFQISFGRLAPLIVLTGMPQSRCYADIRHGELVVRMSWAFRSGIPITSIIGVTPVGDRRIGSIGVHGWRRRWLVNGSLRGLVTIDIDPATRCRVIGLPLGLAELTVSLDDPDGFIAALDNARR